MTKKITFCGLLHVDVSVNVMGRGLTHFFGPENVYKKSKKEKQVNFKQKIGGRLKKNMPDCEMIRKTTILTRVYFILKERSQF